MPRSEAIGSLLKTVKTIEEFSVLPPFQMEILLTSKEKPNLPIEQMARLFVVASLAFLKQNPNGTDGVLITRQIKRHEDALAGGNKGLAEFYLEEAERRSSTASQMRNVLAIGGEFDNADKLIERNESESTEFLNIAVSFEKAAQQEPHVSALKRD